MSKKYFFKKKVYQKSKARQKSHYILRETSMPAYVISGHGCDLNTRTRLVKFVVPPGCAYVTYEECGMVSWGNFFKGFASLEDPSKHHFMNDPIRYENELKQHFGGSLHIYKPGETYVDAQYELLLDYSTPTRKGIYKSGIFEIGKPFHAIDITAPIPYISRYGIDIHNNMVTHAILGDIYKDSIFPMGDTVKSLVTDPISLDGLKTEIGRNSIRQSRLFSLMPGIYYNFVCRPVCVPTGLNLAANERERGNMMTNVTVPLDIQLEKGPRNTSEFLQWFGQRYPEQNLAKSPPEKRHKTTHAVEHIPLPPTFAVGLGPRSRAVAHRPGYSRKAKSHKNPHKKSHRKTRRRSPSHMSLSL